MAGKYATGTTVAVETTRFEIEKTLRRYRADAFAYSSAPQQAQIAFAMNGLRFRFTLRLPSATERRFTHHSQGARTAAAAEKAWEQACRSAWRALLLVIRAKLEAVEAGITTLEDEFLAHTILPNGQTVGEAIAPQIALTYQNGNMPPLLGHG